MHPQLLPGSHLMDASGPKVAAITLKGNNSLIFHGLITLTVVAIFSPLGKPTEQLQLWHNSLPGPEWHNLLHASHILIQVSVSASTMPSRAACCIAEPGSWNLLIRVI